jgi:PilZ domain
VLSTRKHPRVSIATRVTILTPTARVEGEAGEIGAGGMSVRCGHAFGVSQPVELRFSLPPDGPEIRMAAVVWWRKDGHAGFRFDLHSAHREVIERWIEQRMQAAKYFRKPI